MSFASDGLAALVPILTARPSVGSAAVAVLVIRASEANQHGGRFWLGNEMVWLADYIPPAFIGEDSGG